MPALIHTSPDLAHIHCTDTNWLCVPLTSSHKVHTIHIFLAVVSFRTQHNIQRLSLRQESRSHRVRLAACRRGSSIKISQDIFLHSRRAGFQLLIVLDFQLRYPQHGVLVLASNRLDLPVPPLRLLLDSHWLCLCSHNCRPAFEESLIHVRGTLECIIPGADACRTVQAQYITWHDARHVKWQTHRVTNSDKIWLSVNVYTNVVGGLYNEEW